MALVRKSIDDVSATLRIIVLGSEREILSFDTKHVEVTRCCFSLNGRFFAISSSSARLRILDLRAGKELAGVTEEGLSDFRYTADGSRICISAGERMRVFDAGTLEQESEFVVKQSIASFDVAADGRHVALGGARKSAASRCGGS